LNSREKGFLLLTCQLGDADRRPLTPPQLRTLAQRVSIQERPVQDRELQEEDLLAMGYHRVMAQRILRLLADEELLDHMIHLASRTDCVPISRVNPAYPLILRHRLGLESPGCLWVKGDLSILETPTVSLVGSRDLREVNQEFAWEVGRQAAIQGLTLVSGNARGADRAGQEACLAAGGKVISFVADDLSSHPVRKNLLYISEDGFNEPFSTQRALSRNRCIHAMGRLVFVAQCDLGKGGTWDGTVKNLRHGWSPVACFRDGSPASLELEQMGAFLVGKEEIRNFGSLQEAELNFLDR